VTLARTDGRTLYGQSVSTERQREWLREGSVPVAVYGLGKMGLPLAAVYAETTGNVVGVDVDDATVERINRGECPVENEPRLPYLVSEAVESGRLRATTDSRAAAAAASIHVVIVPTTLTEDDVPDLSTLEAAVRDVGSGLSAGDVVMVESTVPPGTCRGFVRPLLESESGLSVGEFGIAFCPERTASGRAIHDIRAAYPKVVGGIDDESTRVAELVYGQLTENRVIPVSDVTVAECVKVFEGAYRDVNIALANELAQFADGLDVDAIEAIEVANTQPFCDIHDPGAGVGGHCIPYYPYFLIEEADAWMPMLETARAVNESMPAFAASKLLEGLDRAGIDPGEATVAVLGVAYRPGVAETRESPAFPIAERLTEAGATVVAVDPVVSAFPELEARPTTIESLPDLDLDGVVLVTAHEEFDRIDWDAFDDLAVVDGRDALDLGDARHAVYTIGRG
jgi:UDP-N-acetyl-D-mannosaminuronic acid dehydrogenase